MEVTREQVKDFLKNMSLMDAAALVKELETELGVSAAAPMAVAAAAPAGGGAAAAAVEKDEFNVVLTAGGEKKIQVIKVVRELTSLGLKEAKDLVDGAPKPVLEKAAKEAKIKAKEDAEKAAKEKEAADKAAREDGKKAKEAAKNAAKKNKRTIRGAVKDANYFVDGEAPPAQIDGALNDVDSIILKLEVEELSTLATALNGKDKAGIKQVFQDERKRLIEAGKAKDGDLKTLA